MQLRLNREASPENAARFAQDIVAVVARLDGAMLDYSPGSLVVVDGIVERFRSEGVAGDQIAETLFNFGCYVGEVLVRNAGAVWMRTAETPLGAQAGWPLVLQLPDGTLCNPIGKVFKRLRNGPEDSLPYFFEVFGARRDGSRPNPAGAPSER